MKVLGSALSVLACCLSGACAALAGTPQQAVCAVQQAIACTATEACDRALPAAVNLPVLLRLDLAENMVISRLQNGTERTSTILSQNGDDSYHVIQGVEGGAGWSMSISLESGQFTIASATVDEGFTAFGVCSASLLD